MFELVRSARFDGMHGQGAAHVPADLAFLADHFPGAPTLPGSLALELAAQIAGPLAEQAVQAQLGLERCAFLAMVKSARFTSPVALPADLDIAAELRRVEPSSVIAAVTITVGGVETSRAELVMAMQPPEPGWADAIARARARVTAWSRA
jgi:3-hydroxymyristoyl/3-hydroxydecanoyl-(acyl carrier protein) dehydratase